MFVFDIMPVLLQEDASTAGEQGDGCTHGNEDDNQ